MFELVVQGIVAPLLVGASTLAARRWGHQVGGLVSAFPAIVGPVLLVGAHRHGPAFAAQAATGTLLGLAALSGFAVAYGRTARRCRWPASAAVGWAVAAVIAPAMAALAAGWPAALLTACVSLVLAHRALPRAAVALPPPAPRGELPLRMAATVLLVTALAAAGTRLGPTVGGVLAALPLLACLLAVFTHRRHGAAAAAQLLRGMLGGMAGFVVFCLLVAALVDRLGVATTFALAAAAALAAQALTAVAAAPGGRPAA